MKSCSSRNRIVMRLRELSVKAVAEIQYETRSIIKSDWHRPENQEIDFYALILVRQFQLNKLHTQFI